jgi:hypothetical protein
MARAGEHGGPDYIHMNASPGSATLGIATRYWVKGPEKAQGEHQGGDVIPAPQYIEERSTQEVR